MSWNTIKLGDAATFINGYAFKPSEWKKSGLPIIRIQDLTGNGYEQNFFDGQLKDKYLVRNGDLLISWSASLGVFEWRKNDAWLNQHIFKVAFDKLEWDKTFFKYLVDYKINEIEREVHGSTMKHITKGKFDNIKIPHPPLHIQRRIAAILHEADALRQKDQQLLKKYEELRESLFYQMFGDISKNEKRWKLGQIRDIVSEVKYGTSKPAEENGMYPYLRMNNITYLGDWDFSGMKHINLDEKEKEKYILSKGDLVFNRTNSKELVGKTAVYDRDDNMAIAGYLIKVKTNELSNPYYISGFLNSKYGKVMLRGICKNIIGMANINAQELQNIKIPIPPKELQDEFEIKFKQAKELKELANEQIKKSEVLFQSLLQKAFKGELVK